MTRTMKPTSETCYACKGAGHTTTDSYLTGTTITFTCSVCRGTGVATCVGCTGEGHWMTCPVKGF